MKTFLSGIAAAGLMMAWSAQAADDTYGTTKTNANKMNVNNMVVDTNGDGVISKSEFTKHHEKMWNEMQKNSSGMVDSSTWKSSMGHGNCNDNMSSGQVKRDKPLTPVTPENAPSTDRPPPRI